ncbi:hypothetical protein [Streptomyces sp. BBFR102]|uniref:hypothetical protein n=1 Tax=Streptomyces sp. BBFR102 TaxID=3448171 RepID=UPI003F532795
MNRARAARRATALAAVLLLAAGCGGRPTTHHKPGTSHEEATAGAGRLLAERDAAGHRYRELPPGQGPSVRVTARPDSEDGWNLLLTLSRFRLTPDSTGSGAVPGRGHARLLVDGKETARLYGTWHHLPAADLPGPGPHRLTVRLHADDHTVWVRDGRPVQSTHTLGAQAGERPGPSARTVELTVTDGRVTPPLGRTEVKKGDRVTLKVRSDRDDTLHVHGYDKAKKLVAGESATLTFTAGRTGLFEVETHGTRLVLTQLLVR